LDVFVHYPTFMCSLMCAMSFILRCTN